MRTLVLSICFRRMESRWTIQTHSDELNWARRQTFHELNSLSLVRLMKSSTFGLDPVNTHIEMQTTGKKIQGMCRQMHTNEFLTGFGGKLNFASSVVK